jgi:hypothetical protein
MKKAIIFVFALMLSVQTFGQTAQGLTLKQSADSILPNAIKDLGKEVLQNILSGTLNQPQLYNDTWGSFVNYAVAKDSAKWSFLKDLNIKFNTFQSTTSSASALGLSYDFNFSKVKFKANDKSRTSHSINLKASGNVSFNRDVNPTDFLSTSLDYSFTKFFGGVVKKADTATFSALNNITDKLAFLKDPAGKEAQDLWKQYYSYLQFTNQYYISFAPKLSLEANQNFTSKQFVYSGNLALGAKAWNKNSALTWLNIFDYPFALIRWIVMPDTKFQPYGSTFPTFMAGINYVDPINDPARQAIGDTSGFERYNLESSFRTFVARVENESIFFNADIRYYKEIDASAAVKAAKLDEHFYFVGALQTSTGFYVSYARGKLPFDAIDDEVYAVGFNYKF